MIRTIPGIFIGNSSVGLHVCGDRYETPSRQHDVRYGMAAHQQAIVQQPRRKGDQINLAGLDDFPATRCADVYIP